MVQLLSEPHPGFEPGTSAVPRRRLSTEACAAFGRNGNRTHDLRLAGPAPSRLGYAPVLERGRIELPSQACEARVFPLDHRPLVEYAGVEPAASCLPDKRSPELS